MKAQEIIEEKKNKVFFIPVFLFFLFQASE